MIGGKNAPANNFLPIMTPITQIITRYIKHSGPMPVSDVMRLALLHPQHGYYHRKPAIGKENDFITAPEISALFGLCIAAWVYRAWQEIGEPSTVPLIELGPGRGTLMRDIMAALPAPARKAMQIMLVEANPTLKEQQQKRLQSQAICWLPSWSALPEGQKIVIGNEFLDTLPINQIIKKDERWYERAIDLNSKGGLYFCLGKPYLSVLPPNAAAMKEGALCEIPKEALSLVQVLCEDIRKTEGAALLIDYGSTDFTRGDSLQAVQDHQKISVLESLGEADLSAHVPFAWLKALAQTQKLNVRLSRQGEWLQSFALNVPQKEALNWERLCQKEQMGTLFKVLEIASFPIKKTL